jgi:hypothetical protein
MLHRIRKTFGNGNEEIILDNQVQADEIYVGGANANRHIDKKHKDEEGNYIEMKATVMGYLSDRAQVRPDNMLL